MGLVVPDALEVEVLTTLLTPALTIKIYGNNITPVGTNIAADFIEISGGGYASKPLTLAHWTITSGNPSIALYDATQLWTFTGTIGGTGNLYGYFVTRNSDGKLLFAERFPSGQVPFAPVNGSQVRVLPRFTADSLF